MSAEESSSAMTLTGVVLQFACTWVVGQYYSGSTWHLRDILFLLLVSFFMYLLYSLRDRTFTTAVSQIISRPLTYNVVTGMIAVGCWSLVYYMAFFSLLFADGFIACDVAKYMAPFYGLLISQLASTSSQGPGTLRVSAAFVGLTLIFVVLFLQRPDTTPLMTYICIAVFSMLLKNGLDRSLIKYSRDISDRTVIHRLGILAASAALLVILIVLVSEHLIKAKSSRNCSRIQASPTVSSHSKNL